MFKKTILVVMTASLSFAAAAQAFIPEDAPTKPTCKDNSAQCQHDKDSYQLTSMVFGCKKTEKQAGGMTAIICVSKGKVVAASEAITEAGDGLGYYFKNGKVVAMRYFHDGNLAIFNNGKLVKLYEDGGSPMKVKTTFTAAERNNMENTAATGYRSILKKFGR
jgi:hypothetical protein